LGNSGAARAASALIIMATKNNRVTVACKIPNGLLLRVFNMVPAREQTPTGFRDIEKAKQVGDTVKINGPAVPFGQALEHSIVGGYALTSNVDKEFFEAWLRQNEDHTAVKAGLVFAHGNLSVISDRAKEQKEVLSGLEPLNPDRTTRNGKSVPVDPRFPSQIERSDAKQSA
jgi:hypothetical protein